MVQIDIVVNDRTYKVTCDDGQEQRLHRLADHIDRQVRSLATELGQIGDARLMLLAALTVTDELYEAKAKLVELERAADALDPETVGGAPRVVEAAARRGEGMTERLADA
ncbi:MAG: cell division protein ZapA [Parvularculaceae bacterium]|nr:cell division protein ZapA [Parvularculaceae bacterium]